MTERSLPRLDRSRLPLLPTLPHAATEFLIHPGPPSEVVAYDLLLHVVTPEEARRQQKDFAHTVIEPRRLRRLGAGELQAVDSLTTTEILEWLEAAWLAEQDMGRGMPDPRRWARGALGDGDRKAPPYLG